MIFESTPPDKDKAIGTSEISCELTVSLIIFFMFKFENFVVSKLKLSNFSSLYCFFLSSNISSSPGDNLKIPLKIVSFKSFLPKLE